MTKWRDDLKVTNKYELCGIVREEVWYVPENQMAVLKGVEVEFDFTYVVFEKVFVSKEYDKMQRGERQDVLTLYQSRVKLMKYIKQYWEQLNMIPQVYFRPNTGFIFEQFNIIE